MDLAIGGRVALITGGSKGIGLATARMLAEEGCRVSIGARGGEGLLVAEAELQALNAEVLATQADITRREDVERLVQQTVETFGTLDIVVHNAGSSVMAERYRAHDPNQVPLKVDEQGGWSVPYGFEDASEADWEYSHTVNVRAPIWLVRAALPHLRHNGWGRIVLVSSIGGRQRGVNQWEYHVTKSAEIALANCLAADLLRDNILVNSVCPGTTATELARDMAETVARRLGTDPAEILQKYDRAPYRPMSRLARPEEIASVIVFLCSERASYVNGAAVNVDGGFSRSLIG